MNKQEIYDYLKSREIWHEITEHEAVYNMEEVAQIQLPYPEQEAKNLFVRDDKKKNYYLITVKGEKRVDLKEFRSRNNTRRLGFASESDLMEILGLIPGAVTPFGLLNDEDDYVQLIIDKEVAEGEWFVCNTGINTTHLKFKTQDLLKKFLPYTHHRPRIVDL